MGKKGILINPTGAEARPRRFSAFGDGFVTDVDPGGGLAEHDSARAIGGEGNVPISAGWGQHPLPIPSNSGMPRQQSWVCHQHLSISFDFPICFTADLFQRENSTFVEIVASQEPHRRHRLLCVIDRGVAACNPRLTPELVRYVDDHAAHMTLVAPPAVVQGGESAKNDPTCLQEILALLHRNEIDRQSFVVAIGGGAVLDLVGYAAATTHRGVRLIRVPTTVLAQNDAGIGVKNGVNAFGTKNYLGTFAPPFAVICDLNFIDTLHRRDKIAGMAEAVKVGLIRDRAFFCWLESNQVALASFELAAMGDMIRHSAKLHLEHTATCGDPFELGSARPLDFGHWAAHKLESLSGHRLRHGEAVAIGMALDSRYSVQQGMLAEEALERICRLLEQLGFRLWDDALEQIDPNGEPVFLQGIDEFRQHLGGELTVTMLTGVGAAVEIHELDKGIILDVVTWLRQRDAER